MCLGVASTAEMERNFHPSLSSIKIDFTTLLEVGTFFFELSYSNLKID